MASLAESTYPSVVGYLAKIPPLLKTLPASLLLTLKSAQPKNSKNGVDHHHSTVHKSWPLRGI